MSELEKSNDLNQKIEEQAHFLDNAHSILAYGKIPSSFFLLTKTVSFYARNFLKIFFLSNFYFALIFTSFVFQLFYFYNPIAPIIIPILLTVLYICTVANLVLEEENGILILTRYSLAEIVPTIYSCFIFASVACGIAVLAFVPKVIFLVFLSDFHLFKIVSNLTSIALFVTILVWYSLFLFISVDESQYGFKSLFRSSSYVGVNFLDFLIRFVVCVAIVPVVFTAMNCVVEGVVIGVNTFNEVFSISYDKYYYLNKLIENKLSKYGISIIDQYVLLQSWFVKIVFVVPFLTIYLGFLYSTLSCEKPLETSFSGSLLHKILLGLFFITGIAVMLIFYEKQIPLANIIKLLQ